MAIASMRSTPPRSVERLRAMSAQAREVLAQEGSLRVTESGTAPRPRMGAGSNDAASDGRGWDVHS